MKKTIPLAFLLILVVNTQAHSQPPWGAIYGVLDQVNNMMLLDQSRQAVANQQEYLRQQALALQQQNQLNREALELQKQALRGQQPVPPMEAIDQERAAAQRRLIDTIQTIHRTCDKHLVADAIRRTQTVAKIIKSDAQTFVLEWDDTWDRSSQLEKGLVGDLVRVCSMCANHGKDRDITIVHNNRIVLTAKANDNHLTIY